MNNTKKPAFTIRARLIIDELKTRKLVTINEIMTIIDTNYKQAWHLSVKLNEMGVSESGHGHIKSKIFDQPRNEFIFEDLLRSRIILPQCPRVKDG